MKGWVAVPAVFPLVVGPLVAWRLVVYLNRQRTTHLAHRLGQLGFHMTEKPTAAAKTEFAAPVIHLFDTLGLSTGAVAIEWLAVQNSVSAKILLFEHRFFTGSGRGVQENCHTVAAWPFDHPEISDSTLPNASWFMLGRYPLLLRHAYQKDELKEAAFADLARDWTLHGNASTGARFLTPRVRALLQRSPIDEQWCIGAGWICCAFRGTLDDKNTEFFLDHARAILATQP